MPVLSSREPTDLIPEKVVVEIRFVRSKATPATRNSLKVNI